MAVRNVLSHFCHHLWAVKPNFPPTRQNFLTFLTALSKMEKYPPIKHSFHKRAYQFAHLSTPDWHLHFSPCWNSFLQCSETEQLWSNFYSSKVLVRDISLRFQISTMLFTYWCSIQMHHQPFFICLWIHFLTLSRGMSWMSQIVILHYRLKKVINSYVLLCSKSQRIAQISVTRT